MANEGVMLVLGRDFCRYIDIWSGLYSRSWLGLYGRSGLGLLVFGEGGEG